MEQFFTMENVWITLSAFILGAVLTRTSYQNATLKKVEELIRSSKSESAKVDEFINRDEDLRRIIEEKQQQANDLEKDVRLLQERKEHIKSSDAFKQAKELETKMEKMKSLLERFDKIKSHKDIFESTLLANMFKELYELHYGEGISDTELRRQLLEYGNIDETQKPSKTKPSSNTRGM